MIMLGAEYVAEVLGAPCTALKDFQIMESWCELCEGHEYSECWKELILRAENKRRIKRAAQDADSV